MSLKKITNRVYYLPHEEETDRPVLGYIKGDKYSLAIDAGNSKDHVNKFYDSLKQSGFDKPDLTVITHWHWDHTFGMHAIEGKSISCNSTNQKLIEVSKWGWSDEDMSLRLKTGEDIEFCDKYIKVEYENRNDIKVVTSDIIFDGSMIIDLGGIHCVLMHVVSPHSSDSVLVYIPEERVLFAGDSNCEDFYDNNGEYDKEKLQSFIKTIKEIQFDIYIMSHDNVETKESILGYLQDILSKLL